MLPTPKSFDIFPSVVLADTVTKMTVVPAERAFIIPDGRVYSLKVISVGSDENYYSPQGYKILELSGKDGMLSFDFEFIGEGEHRLELLLDEKSVAVFTVYSLHEDLYRLRPLKGDLHSHSCRSDGTRDPASQAGHYREEGYDFVALTDHNRYYPGGEIDEAYEGVNTGLLRIRGEEVHSPQSVVHIVHVGGSKSIAEEYVKNREEYEKEIEKYLEKVPEEIPEAYKSRYAKAMWATDAIHAAGGLAIFPHPFWRPNASKCYNLPKEFAEILLKSGMFDAFEIVGAMTQADINRALALWTDLRGEGYKINLVGSSDVHSLERSPHFPYHLTVCFAEEKSEAGVIDAVRCGNSVAVEIIGDNYDRQYFCYGSFRLVSYAQFLLQNYFPRLQRLTAGIGVSMRAYAMEEAGAEVIEAQNAIAEAFSERFFGRLAPKAPSEKLISFEEKWRAVQLDGPRARGSSVDAAPAKRLI